MSSATLANPRRTRIDAWPPARTETPDPRGNAGDRGSATVTVSDGRPRD